MTKKKPKDREKLLWKKKLEDLEPKHDLAHAKNIVFSVEDFFLKKSQMNPPTYSTSSSKKLVY